MNLSLTYSGQTKPQRIQDDRKQKLANYQGIGDVSFLIALRGFTDIPARRLIKILEWLVIYWCVIYGDDFCTGLSPDKRSWSENFLRVWNDVRKVADGMKWLSRVLGLKVMSEPRYYPMPMPIASKEILPLFPPLSGRWLKCLLNPK